MDSGGLFVDRLLKLRRERFPGIADLAKPGAGLPRSLVKPISMGTKHDDLILLYSIYAGQLSNLLCIRSDHARRRAEGQPCRGPTTDVSCLSARQLCHTLPAPALQLRDVHETSTGLSHRPQDLSRHERPSADRPRPHTVDDPLNAEPPVDPGRRPGTGRLVANAPWSPFARIDERNAHHPCILASAAHIHRQSAPQPHGPRSKAGQGDALLQRGREAGAGHPTHLA
jgi:hypothetical protein